MTTSIRRARRKGTVHQFAVSIDDPTRASEIAQAIDKMFANSSAETTTLNDREYVASQFRQVGDVRMFVNSIIGAVLFTLLFLAGNTMSQSVNDRVPELGVLKTLGFGDNAILLLVVVEAALLCLVAAAIGPRCGQFSKAYSVRQFTSPFRCWQGLRYRLRPRGALGRSVQRYRRRVRVG
jgi:putative ABC transport system permease protein